MEARSLVPESIPHDEIEIPEKIGIPVVLRHIALEIVQDKSMPIVMDPGTAQGIATTMWPLGKAHWEGAYPIEEGTP
jgi:hypothetical protein